MMAMTRNDFHNTAVIFCLLRLVMLVVFVVFAIRLRRNNHPAPIEKESEKRHDGDDGIVACLLVELAHNGDCCEISEPGGLVNCQANNLCAKTDEMLVPNPSATAPTLLRHALSPKPATGRRH